MAYTPTNWIDGVTPVSAANLNNLEGGVNDLTDTGILDKKIVTDSSNTVKVLYGAISAGGESATIASTNTGVLFYIVNSTFGGAYVWRTDNLLMIGGNAGQSSFSLSGSTLTITNNHVSNTLRYIAIVN